MQTQTAETRGLAAAKTHISLNVKDVDRSVAFYEAFFGTTAHKRRPGYANFDLDNPGLKLALQEGPAEGRGSLSHLGIQVATSHEVNAARDRIQAAGLASFDEGATECCYARQDKIWVTDPDGNSWEVYVLLDDMQDDAGSHDHAAGARVVEETCCPSVEGQAG